MHSIIILGYIYFYILQMLSTINKVGISTGSALFLVSVYNSKYKLELDVGPSVV